MLVSIEKAMVKPVREDPDGTRCTLYTIPASDFFAPPPAFSRWRKPVLSIVTFRWPLVVDRCLETLPSLITFTAAIFSQISQPKSTVLPVIGMNKSFPIPSASESNASRDRSMMINASPRLHTAPCLQARNAISRYSTLNMAIEKAISVWITSGEVEEVYSGKNHQEPTEKRYGVDGVSCVETLEENERSA